MRSTRSGLRLATRMTVIPPALADWPVELKSEGTELVFTFEAQQSERIGQLLRKLTELGVGFKDLNTRESSLEDIFVSLVHTR